MKLDTKLLAGIAVGLVIGLHYHASLIAYLPLMMVATLILVLKVIHR